MMVAGAVLGGAGRAMPRSATLGALVFLAGAALVYWSLFRSRDGRGLFGLGAYAAQDGASKAGRRMVTFEGGKAAPGGAGAPEGGAGSDARTL